MLVGVQQKSEDIFLNVLLEENFNLIGFSNALICPFLNHAVSDNKYYTRLISSVVWLTESEQKG